MIEIVLPWPVGLSPNRARTMPMAARTGHEADDRRKAKSLTLEQVTTTAPPGWLELDLIAYPPYKRHLDALSFHFSLKASLDGVADALGINDRFFWPPHLWQGAPVPSGKVVVRIRSAISTLPPDMPSFLPEF